MSAADFAFALLWWLCREVMHAFYMDPYVLDRINTSIWTICSLIYFLYRRANKDSVLEGWPQLTACSCSLDDPQAWFWATQIAWLQMNSKEPGSICRRMSSLCVFICIQKS